MSRKIIIATLLILSLALTACRVIAPDKVRLTEKDANKVVLVAKKGRVTVVLNANPSTGFVWLISPKSGIRLKIKGGARFEPNSKAIGSPGKQLIIFKMPGKAGKERLLLVYKRPWEKNIKPEKSFNVWLKIR